VGIAGISIQEGDVSSNRRARARTALFAICVAAALLRGAQLPAANAQTEDPPIEPEATLDPTATPQLPPSDDERGNSQDPDDQGKRATVRIYLPTLSQNTPAGAYDGPPQSQNDDHNHNGHSHEEIDTELLSPEREQEIYEWIKSNNFGNPNFYESAQLERGKAVANSTNGRWDGPYDWPIVAVHAVLMPNGKVMAYDSIGDRPTESYVDHNSTRAVVYDPNSNSTTRVDVNTGFNLFCSGASILPDGRVFLAGGNSDKNLAGLDKTHVFNTWTNSWSLENTLQQGQRWYPSVTTLANGEALITGGGPTTPEVRRADGSLRSLTGANLDYAAGRYYYWLKQAPNGKVVALGPQPDLRYLNTGGSGSWEGAFVTRPDNFFRNYGAHAMYDVGRVLIAGGSTSNSAAVVDLNNGTVQNTASMASVRAQHNLTVLANGEVLVTGGNTSNELANLNSAVYSAEIWNPSSGQWRNVAPMRVSRQYHSIALLLPDGRVLTAGGGICGQCADIGYLMKNAEIYSPPYLFNADGSAAARPGIRNASEIYYNRGFRINSLQAGSISKVALIRLESATHSVGMEQRYIPLNYRVEGNDVIATGPQNGNIAPPGWYHLIISNGAGTPSWSWILKLGGAPAEPTSWVKCADENGTCNFSGTRWVRYGANGFYTYRNASNSISCSNRAFGDPYYGTGKVCEYADSGTAQPASQRTYIEAESASLSSPMLNVADSSASNGRRINVGQGNNAYNSAPGSGYATFTFNANSAGNYKIWGRTIAPTTDDNSFWVQIDGGTWYKWNNIPLSTGWAWDDMHNADNGNAALVFNLTAGQHTLRIAYREDGTLLDRILITNDLSFRP
jgi:hypothetical protein